MSEVRFLDATEARLRAPELSRVLVDCVAGGASVSFMAGFSQAEGEAFFARAADGVGAGERLLLAAFVETRLVGTVQLLLAMPPNQPHRAELSKLLVHREARGRGLGHSLITTSEALARERGKTLTTLDTAGADAERLYERCGYARAGVIPNYALWPDGRSCATTFFWKALA